MAAGLLPCVSALCAAAAELRTNEVALAAREDGCGFIDTIAFAGREVVQTRPDFVGGHIRLARAGTGTAESMFAHASAVTLPSRVTAGDVGDGVLTQRGAYRDGTTAIPFTRRLTLVDNCVTVRERADFAGLSDRYSVSDHRLVLPLVVCEDEHLRLFAFGGARRAELFRMDMNDETHRNQSISAPRAHRPYWDLGGVTQDRHSYHLWRANHADTMAYPIESGAGAPGWADYSELEWGVTVQVTDAFESAPWEIMIDARKGTLAVAMHPPSEVPRNGKDLGVREFAFSLTFHDSSWPSAQPCELPHHRYRELLSYLNTPGSRYTFLNYICGGLGVTISDGTRTDDEMRQIARRIILKERYQPSVLLRLLYRGDAYRMQALVRAILGRSVPRQQPMAKWEQDVAELLEKIRDDGLPAKQ